MFRKPIFKKIIIAAILAWGIAALQYSLDRGKYLRLKKTGIIIPASSSYSKHWGGEYADFYFVTLEGVRVQHSEKCGSKKTFDEQYANMFVIYNPKKPTEFENFYDYTRYFGSYRKFFFLFLYPLFLTFFILMGIKVVKGLYLFFSQGFPGRNRPQL